MQYRHAAEVEDIIIPSSTDEPYTTLENVLVGRLSSCDRSVRQLPSHEEMETANRSNSCAT